MVEWALSGQTRGPAPFRKQWCVTWDKSLLSLFFSSSVCKTKGCPKWWQQFLSPWQSGFLFTEALLPTALKLPILEQMADIPICHKGEVASWGVHRALSGFHSTNGPSLRSVLLNNFRPYNGEKVKGICFETVLQILNFGLSLARQWHLATAWWPWAHYQDYYEALTMGQTWSELLRNASCNVYCTLTAPRVIKVMVTATTSLWPLGRKPNLR